jgi:hypothetical protein
MRFNNDPWAEIGPASENGLVSARRAAAGGKWSFFWARDNDSRCLLLLKHSPAVSLGQKLPELKGLELVRVVEGHGDGILVLRLLDASLREPFLTLCRDVIAAAEAQKDEVSAVAAAVARTWRWHYLLRGGRRRLTAEQQKGLIGELLTLRDLIMPKFGPRVSIEAWRGPLGAAQDFRVGEIAIECKARLGAQLGYLAISSEHQLDDAGMDALFLRILYIEGAQPEAAGAFTLPSLIEEITEKITRTEQAALDLFLGRLDAAGLRLEEDYSGDFWALGPVTMVAVTDGFPRLIPTTLPVGISAVSYSLAVSACQHFLLDDHSIWDAVPRPKG